MGVLLQGNGLLTDLTVAENVALPLRTHTRLPTAVLRRLVEMKLHAVACWPPPMPGRASCPAAWRAVWRWPVRWRWTRR